MSKVKDLLVVTEEDKILARRHYEKNENDIKEDVAILKEWLRQQPHLPNDEDEGRLERMFLKNKCRMEQTKGKLDTCYSFKIFHPDILELYDINSLRIENSRKSLIFVPLPKLTDKQERVFFFKVTDSDIVNGFDGFLYLLMMMELCITHDYSVADIHLVDWTGVTLKAMKTVEPSIVHKFTIIAMAGLSGRFSSFQYINVPKFVDIFLQMVKLVLKPKLFNKIRCCSKIEEIYDVVPKHMLPIEYGGEERSIYEIHEDWGKELQYHTDLLSKLSKRTSNEKLRTAKMNESDLFGTDGTFKKINLD